MSTRLRQKRASHFIEKRCAVESEASIHPVKVEGSGKLTTDIKAPRGTKVGLSGSGLFRRTEMSRQTQIELAADEPPNPA